MIWPILEARPEIIQKISTAFWTMEFQGKLLLNWCWHCKESIFEIRLPFSKHDLLPISHCSLSFSISFNFGFTTDAQFCKKNPLMEIKLFLTRLRTAVFTFAVWCKLRIVCTSDCDVWNFHTQLQLNYCILFGCPGNTNKH